ncbi:putative ABC transporter (permease protein) [Bradyrhizobium sp. STM 3809]|nr:putative ABC transporter (permease protein) [Bradyrhizobium sp. STM 3809]
MISILRVMLLALIRDRGALVMAFVLPPAIYVIFASIFAGTTGDQLRLRVVVLDTVQSAVTQRLAEAIRADPTFRRPQRAPNSREELETMVRQDEADVGILLRADPAQEVPGGPAPVVVIGDSAKAVGTPIVAGQLQRLFAEKLPDAAYRRTFADIERRFVPLEPGQKARVAAILDAMGTQAAEGGTAAASEKPSEKPTPLVEQVTVKSAAGGIAAAVVYYAGAVGVMFLMFSSIQSSMVLIDERQNGIFDRLLSGQGRLGALLGGKFLFLVLQGVLQASLIFIVAKLAYGVDFTARWPEWSALTLAASAAAASFALLLSATCRTREQAQTLSNFIVLVLSALGGSMVPRFLMPPWLQNISAVMPNAWVIDGYHGLLWRDAPPSQIELPIALLAGVTVALFGSAWLVLRLRLRA